MGTPIQQPPAPLPTIQGTPETDQVLDLIEASWNAFKEAEADGKIDLNDIGVLLPVVGKITPAIQDIQKVPAELLDLDSEEGAALLARALSITGSTPEKTRIFVKGVIFIAYGGTLIYRGFKA